MAIETLFSSVKRKLEDVVALGDQVKKSGFSEATVTDMKDHAKTHCDNAKLEIDSMKTAIDNWVG